MVLAPGRRRRRLIDSVRGVLEHLIGEVLEANRALPAHGLVKLTTGNVSGIDREQGLVVIKPSGVAYEHMTAADMVVLDLDGNVVAGERRPSRDTHTHLVLYRTFKAVGAVVHSHSAYATAWAQARRSIPLLGVTHADLCGYPIPLTRALTEEETAGDHETATGRALVEAIEPHGPDRMPCALVRGHAPFIWGATPEQAVHSAVRLEEVARLAFLTTALDPEITPVANPGMGAR
jgi:L-ribulose-5-phosphate 4-epimerase